MHIRQFLKDLRRPADGARPPRGRSRFRRPLGVETLEGRALPSVTYSAANHTLTVNGDDGGVPTNDTISIYTTIDTALLREDVVVVVNGQQQFADSIDFSGGIFVYGLEGDDTLTPIYIAVTFDGGNGSDKLEAGGLFYDWRVTGTNAGVVGTYTFSSVENLASVNTSAPEFRFSDGAG